MTARTWIVTFALLAAATVGCGDNRAPAALQSDAGTAADGPGAPFTPSSIEFVPDEGERTGALWLELAVARPQEQRFTLKIVGDGFDAYGIAGRFLFDTSVANLAGIAAGDALATSDTDLLAAAAGNRQGGYFGVSRSQGERVAVSVTAAATVGTLDFTVHGPGTTHLRWNHVRSLVIDGEAKPVAVSTWLGGTLVVK